MKYRIAMLLKQHLIDYCKSNSPDLSDRFDISYYPYETLAELKLLYLSLKDSYDGFITSGIIPHRFLTEIGRDDEVSFACFRFDIENTYRILLQECIRRGSVDLSRVGIDFLSDSSSSLVQAVTENQLPQAASKFEQYVSLLSAQALDEFELALNQHYLERYQQGELDFIVTYFYSTVQTFADLPIDCYYLYPSNTEYRYAMRSVEQHIYQRKTRQSFPAVIHIDFTPMLKGALSKADLYTTELQRLLLETIDQLNNNLSLKNGSGYFELYTDSRTISQLTNKFHTCALLPRLSKISAFRGTIGYGIAADFYTARSNALRAGRFASQQENQENGSYLIDQNRLLTCLTGSDSLDQKWVTNLPSDYVTQVATQAKLSDATIRKIIGVLVEEGTDEISSSELIDHLGISLRTANRYLSSLEHSGLAKIVGQRSVGGRGRPIHLYKLTLQYPKAP